MMGRGFHPHTPMCRSPPFPKERGIISSERTMKDIDTLNSEARKLFDKPDFALAAELSNKAYKLAVKQKYQRGIAEALLTRGNIFLVQQDNLKAREVYLQACKIIEAMGDKKLQNRAYSVLGIVYANLLLKGESIKYLTLAFEVSKSMKDKKLLAEDYVNLAITLARFGSYAQAIKYYNKAMIYSKKISDEQQQATILINLSKIHSRKGDCEVALQLDFEALQLAEKIKSTRLIITIYHNISGDLISLKRFEEAEEYAKRCIDLAIENNVMPLITHATLLRAEIRLLQEKYDEAINVLKKVEETPGFKGNVVAIYKYYDLFLKVYEATGDFKSAYEKHKELLEFERKQNEISRLVTSDE